MEKIISWGHNVGLHFDASFYNIENETQLTEKLLFEKEFLEKLFGIKIKDFSFHITNPFTNNCQNDTYAGLLNVYAKKIKENITYCSDSNGYWKPERLVDILLDPKTKNLQLLTHPEMWQDKVMSPFERVKTCIKGRADFTRNWYITLLEANNRNNIDW